MSEEQKVNVLGLDNAGKTSLLTRFGGKLGIEDLASLAPTRGVERTKIDTEMMDFIIWDFGGQKDHRSQYLEEPENYFSNTILIIYVIDLQDPERYEESVSYLKKILKIMEDLEEDPYILIFIHKYDPNLKKDDKLIGKIKEIKELIKPVINKTDFNYEIFLTSIYSSFPKQPQFVDLVKEIIEGKPLEQETLEAKVKRVSEVLESSLNAVVKLSSNIIRLEKRLSFLEENLLSDEVLTQKQESSKKKELKGKKKAKKVDIKNIRKETVSQLQDIIVDKEEE